MIILESEWDEVAGVVEPSERDSETSSAKGVVRRSVQSAEVVHAAASQSSIGRASRSSESNGVLQEAATGSAADVGQLSSYRDSANPAIAGPVSYTFSPILHAPNTMVLRTQPTMIPIYHISVRMNCFIPSSYITTITRGDTIRGEEVGQFEMGLTIKKETVIIDGLEKAIDAVLTKGGTRMSRTWQWKFDSDQRKHLSWTFDNPVKYCYAGTRSVGNASNVLASFTPPPLTPRADGRPAPAASLKVFPNGQYLFDHILISALILERRRLSQS